MKPYLTPEARRKAVYDFVAGCYNQTTKITDYAPLTASMNDAINPLNLLIKMEKTGEESYQDGTVLFGMLVNKKRKNGLYSDDDAKSYVDHLMHIVLGSVPETEEKIGLANEQLFSIMGILRENIEKDSRVTYILETQWAEEFERYEKALEEYGHEAERRLDSRDADLSMLTKELQELWDEIKTQGENFQSQLKKEHGEIREVDESVMNALEKIIDWQRKYEPCLKELNAEYEERNEKLNKVFKEGDSSGSKREPKGKN